MRTLEYGRRSAADCVSRGCAIGIVVTQLSCTAKRLGQKSAMVRVVGITTQDQTGEMHLLSPGICWIWWASDSGGCTLCGYP
jgi:hypothetical protein